MPFVVQSTYLMPKQTSQPQQLQLFTLLYSPLLAATRDYFQSTVAILVTSAIVKITKLMLFCSVAEATCIAQGQHYCGRDSSVSVLPVQISCSSYHGSIKRGQLLLHNNSRSHLASSQHGVGTAPLCHTNSSNRRPGTTQAEQGSPTIFLPPTCN